MIGSRDFEYVEARLLAPAVALQEAVERLDALGLSDLARETNEAMQRLVDDCRAIRARLTDRYHVQHRTQP